MYKDWMCIVTSVSVSFRTSFSTQYNYYHSLNSSFRKFVDCFRNPLRSSHVLTLLVPKPYTGNAVPKTKKTFNNNNCHLRVLLLASLVFAIAHASWSPRCLLYNIADLSVTLIGIVRCVFLLLSFCLHYIVLCFDFLYFFFFGECI